LFYQMISPRIFPPGVLQLLEILSDKERIVIEELPTSSRNRQRINDLKNQMLMLDPTKQLTVNENHAF
jgi:hypothetical protein